MIRSILKLKNNGTEEFVKLPNGKKRYFKDLISHHQEIARDSMKMEEFEKLYCILQLSLGEKNIPRDHP